MSYWNGVTFVAALAMHGARTRLLCTYMWKNVTVVDIIASYSLSDISSRTLPTLISLIQILTGSPRETRKCLLALIHRLAAFRAPGISTEASWTCSTLILSVSQLCALNTVKAWELIVDARICKETNNIPLLPSDNIVSELFVPTTMLIPLYG